MQESRFFSYFFRELKRLSSLTVGHVG